MYQISSSNHKVDIHRYSRFGIYICMMYPKLPTTIQLEGSILFRNTRTLLTCQIPKCEIASAKFLIIRRSGSISTRNCKRHHQSLPHRKKTKSKVTCNLEVRILFKFGDILHEKTMYLIHSGCYNILSCHHLGGLNPYYAVFALTISARTCCEQPKTPLSTIFV